MFLKYYQDELAWLREMGRELAEARPELARHLAEPGADPDVERLLEGFACLTGRVRQKLDDEFPELTHGLLEMLCPHYLRPIPSLVILQVKVKPNAQAPGLVLPRDALVESVPVDGTRCRFRTVAELATSPVELQELEFTVGNPSALRLRLRTVPRRSIAELQQRPLRLHLAGEPATARALLVALCHYTRRTTASNGAGSAHRELPLELRVGGLGDAEAALPTPSGAFEGFRVLQEYFAFPERFSFVDVHGLGRLGDGGGGEFELRFEFRDLPDAMPPIGSGNVLLDCVPAINLFRHDADPIRAEPGRSEYRVRPTGAEQAHYEVHSVEAVEGRVRGSADVQTYPPFFAFDPQGRASGRFHQLRRRESLRGSGTETYLRLGAEDPTRWHDLETISLDLVCTNRDLPTRLRPGDISRPGAETPAAFTFHNLNTPAAPVPPPLGDEVYWRLLAHMTLNLRRLAEPTSLRTALALYDFRARVDRQARRRLDNLLQAIEHVQLDRAVELFQGVPVNGGDVRVRVDENRLGGDGEVYLLGTVLAEFLASYVSLNTFVRLTIECTGHHERFTWPARLGRRITL